MICKNCGENVIKSDICGNFCVHCHGEIKPYKTGNMRCVWCGQNAEILSNDLCMPCFRKWKNLSIEEMERITIDSWKRATDR